FHGDKGTGKSTLGHILCALAGQHGKPMTSSEHLTGKFNQHMRDAVFVFADEAVAPTDRGAQARMKALITEQQIAYEPKGVDVRFGRSCLPVMMASNPDWFVDAGATDGERRYFVSRVSNKRQNDRAFFEAVRRQAYREGGIQAMLHDLQLLDL